VPNEEVKMQNVDRTLKVATELYLQYGIEGTTKEMIVKASGLSRKSIDRYFSDKLTCVLQVARWVGINVWGELNRNYPRSVFEGRYTGATLLQMYMLDLKKIFMKEPRLFVFYADFKIYFSRNSKDYQRDYAALLDTIGCRRLTEKIYTLGKSDGSLPKEIDPKEEAEYFCRATFGFLTNMAIAHECEPEVANDKIDRYIGGVMMLYRGETETLATIEPEGHKKREMANAARAMG
jgi:AcrR family transcriptional regulator